MKTALTLLAVVTLVVPPDLSAKQLSAEPGNPVVRAGIPESDSELTSGVNVHAQRGDLLRSELRFADAAVEYRRAAHVARREGLLSSGAAGMPRHAYFHDGTPLG